MPGPVAVGEGPNRITAIRVMLVETSRLGTCDQIHKWPQVPARDLYDVIALLAERSRYGPCPVGSDMQQDDPDAQVLHFGNDLPEVLLGADDDGIADRAVPGQRDQVTVDLGLDTFAVARPHPPEPQLQPGKVREPVMLRRPAAFDRRLIPVAAQQGQASPVPRKASEQLKKTWIVERNGIATASAVDGHCPIGEHIARVHEQRAAIHATPSLPSTREVTSGRPSPWQIARIVDPPATPGFLRPVQALPRIPCGRDIALCLVSRAVSPCLSARYTQNVPDRRAHAGQQPPRCGLHHRHGR